MTFANRILATRVLKPSRRTWVYCGLFSDVHPFHMLDSDNDKLRQIVGNLNCIYKETEVDPLLLLGPGTVIDMNIDVCDIYVVRFSLTAYDDYCGGTGIPEAVETTDELLRTKL